MEVPYVYREFTWNCVIVIESLSDEEKTGEELVSSIIGRRGLQHNFGAGYARVNDSSEFFAALEEIAERVAQNGWMPIVHIEAHGSHEGLRLESGEIISWLKVSDALRRINVLTKNNLLVVLAACHGIWIHEQLNIILQAPFWAAVASLEEVSRETIQVGFHDFYEKIATKETDDFEQAILALNQYDESGLFRYIDPELIFEMAWDAYRERYNTIEKVDEMVDALVNNGNIPPDKIDGTRLFFTNTFYMGEEAKSLFKDFHLMYDLQKGMNS